ncbi:MAG TPA: hypothetical protein VF832_16870 [Longimicrobiales bacterium]
MRAGLRLAVMLALGTATSLAGGPARAQEAGPAGTWTIEFVRGIRNENGEETVEKGHARVTLEVRGDSALAQWQVLEPDRDGKPVPPRTLRGTAAGAHLVLTDHRQAQVQRNGDESTVDITVTYDLTIAGDTITGTQAATSADGMISSEPRPVSGKREKAG